MFVVSLLMVWERITCSTRDWEHLGNQLRLVTLTEELQIIACSVVSKVSLMAFCGGKVQGALMFMGKTMPQHIHRHFLRFMQISTFLFEYQLPR